MPSNNLGGANQRPLGPKSRFVLWPNFPTVTHPTGGMPKKTAGFRGRCRFVVLKMLPFAKTFGIDRLDTDVVA